MINVHLPCYSSFIEEEQPFYVLCPVRDFWY